MNETWKDVVDFEGIYQISDLGRLQRVMGRKGTKAGRILSGKKTKDGYVRFALCNAPARDVYRFAHILVLTAFVGECPAGMQGRHLNGQSDDNRLENLAWGTPQQNSDDKLRHGTQVHGELHGQAQLKQSDIIAIRASNLPQSQIASLYGISQQHVSDIKTGKRWKN